MPGFHSFNRLSVLGLTVLDMLRLIQHHRVKLELAIFVRIPAEQGVAGNHKVVLWTGLALSVVLMAIASNAIAKILDRYHWIAWIGFAIILYVAGGMIWDGTHEVVAATGKG